MATKSKKDSTLWEKAKSRFGFWRNLQSYIGVNLFLIVIWYISGGGSFWPAWILVGWGIGLVAQYFQTFHGTSVENEHEKLKKKAKKK